MKTEKVLLSLLAVVVGLLVAGIAFYVLENTKKTIPASRSNTTSVVVPTPTLKPSIFLNVDKPKDEEVFRKKIIGISGKTASDAIVVILKNNVEEVLTPTTSGDFSSTSTLEDGHNIIEITAIAPNGESTRVLKVVTFSTEEF